jgi:hypothetical protein
MGLLDDAIREHLELKRRHGADPQEVARQEDEALGPIGGHEAEHEPEHEPEEPPAPYEEPAAVVHEHQQELELPAVAEETVEEPAEPAEEPPAGVHQATVEYSIEDEREAEAREPEPDPEPETPAQPAEPADELEETPEFLQETPEHDRLWFEQKPPRDFDF